MFIVEEQLGKLITGQRRFRDAADAIERIRVCLAQAPSYRVVSVNGRWIGKQDWWEVARRGMRPYGLTRIGLRNKKVRSVVIINGTFPGHNEWGIFP